MLFLLLTFLLPIGALLLRSVDNPEVVGSLPRTVEALASWDGRGLPAEPAYRAIAEDLAEARRNQQLGDLSKRLNMELAGFRSLVSSTARKLPLREEPASYQTAFLDLDERWGDPAYWQVIRRNASSATPYYLLAALDHRIDDLGELAKATPDQAIYLDIFARTFWMSLVITAICLVLAYPLAYLLANLPTRSGNLLMILVLYAYGLWANRNEDIPLTKFNGANFAKAMWEVKWEMLIPLVVLGGVFSGIFVMGEAAAVTVLYVLFIEVFIYKDIT